MSDKFVFEKVEEEVEEVKTENTKTGGFVFEKVEEEVYSNENEEDQDPPWKPKTVKDKSGNDVVDYKYYESISGSPVKLEAEEYSNYQKWIKDNNSNASPVQTPTFEIPEVKTSNYGKIEIELEKLNKSDKPEDKVKAADIEFEQFVKASGVSKDSDYSFVDRPIDNFFNIIASGVNESMPPTYSISSYSDIFKPSETLPGVDAYIERIYGIPNAQNSYYYKTNSSALTGFEGNLVQLENAFRKKQITPDVYNRATADIQNRFNNILKANLKIQLPKYFNFYANELDEETDELEQKSLEKLQLKIDATPNMKDLDYVATDEEGNINLELTKENLEVEEIIDQVLGGDKEADYTTTTTMEGYGEEEGETFSYTATHKKGIDLEYLGDLRKLLDISIPEDIKDDFNKIRDYQNKTLKELQAKYPNRKFDVGGGLGTVSDEKVNNLIKDYINDRLDDPTSSMGKVLNLKEYEIFYDPTSNKIIRSSSDEDKVIKDNYVTKGLKKVENLDQMLSLIHSLATNEGTDLDYQRPISVLNYINDLQFDIAVLSGKIAKKFPNLNNGIIKQNAEAGEVVVNPKIIDNNDPLIMMYNDAVTKRQMLGVGFALNADLTKISNEGWLTGFGTGLKNVFRRGDDQLTGSVGFDLKREKFYEGLQDVAPGIMYDKDTNPNGFTKKEINDIYSKAILYEVGMGTPAFAQIIAEFALTRRLGGKSIQNIGKLSNAMARTMFGVTAKSSKFARNAVKVTESFVEELAAIELRNIGAGSLYGAEAMSPLFAVSAPVSKALNKFYRGLFKLGVTSGAGKYSLVQMLNKVPQFIQSFSGNFIFKPGTGALVMTVGEAPDAVLDYVKTGNTDALHHLIDPRQFLIKGAQILSTQGIAPVKNIIDTGKQFVLDINNYRKNKAFTNTYEKAKTFFNLGSDYVNARGEKQRDKILNKAVNEKLLELGVNPKFVNSLKGSGITSKQMAEVVNSGKGMDALIEIAENNFKQWQENAKQNGTTQNLAVAKANFKNSIEALKNAKESGITPKELKEKYLNFAEYANFLKMNNLQLNFLDSYGAGEKLNTSTINLAKKVSDTIENQGLSDMQVVSKIIDSGSLSTLRKLGNPELINQVLASYGVRPSVIKMIAGEVGPDGNWNPSGSLLLVGEAVNAAAKKNKISLETKNGEKFSDLELEKWKLSGQKTQLEAELKETKDEYTKNLLKERIKQIEEEIDVKSNVQKVTIEDALVEQKAGAMSTIATAEAVAAKAGQPMKITQSNNELIAFYDKLVEDGEISPEIRDQQVEQIKDASNLKKGQTITTKSGREVVVFNLEAIFKSGGDVTTAAHELVHPWVNSVIKRLGIRSQEAQDAFIDSFKDGMTPQEVKVVTERLKKMGLTYENGGLEVFNAYAEGVAAGEIDAMTTNTYKDLFESLIEGDAGRDVNFDENGFSPELGISMVEIINEFASSLKKGRLDSFIAEDGNWGSPEGKEIAQEQKTVKDGGLAIETGDIVVDQVEGTYKYEETETDVLKRNNLFKQVEKLESEISELKPGDPRIAIKKEKIQDIKNNIATGIKNKQLVVDLLNGKTKTTNEDGKEVDIKQELLRINDGFIQELGNKFNMNDEAMDGMSYTERMEVKQDYVTSLRNEFLFVLEGYLKGLPAKMAAGEAAPLFAYLQQSLTPRYPRLIQDTKFLFGIGEGYNPDAGRETEFGDAFEPTYTVPLEYAMGGSTPSYEMVEVEVNTGTKEEVAPIMFETEGGFNLSDGSKLQIISGIKNWTRLGDGKASNLAENVLDFASNAIKQDLSFSENQSGKTSFNVKTYEENIKKSYKEIEDYILEEGEWLRGRRWNPFYTAIKTEGGSIVRLGKEEVPQYKMAILSPEKMADFLLFRNEFSLENDPNFKTTKRDGTPKTKADIKRETQNKISQRSIKYSQLLGLIKTKVILTEAIANNGIVEYNGQKIDVLGMLPENSNIKTVGDLTKALGLYEVSEAKVQDQMEKLGVDRISEGDKVVDIATFTNNLREIVKEETILQFGTEENYYKLRALAETTMLKNGENVSISWEVDGKEFSWEARDIKNFQDMIISGEIEKSVDASEGEYSFEKEIEINVSDIKENTFLKSKGIENASEWGAQSAEAIEVLNLKKKANQEKAKFNYYKRGKDGRVVDTDKKAASDKMMEKYAPYTFSKEMLENTGLDKNFMMSGEGYKETGHTDSQTVDLKGNPIKLEYSKNKDYKWGENLTDVLSFERGDMLTYNAQNNAASQLLSGRVDLATKNEALTRLTNPKDIAARRKILKAGWKGRFDFIWEEGLTTEQRLERLEFLGSMVKAQSSGQTSGWRALASIIGGEFGNVDKAPSDIKGGKGGERQLEHGIPMLKFSTKALSLIIKGDLNSLMNHCETMEGFFAEKPKLAYVDKLITKTPGGVQAMKGAEIYMMPDGKGGYREPKQGESGAIRLMDVVMIPDGKGGATTISKSIQSSVKESFDKKEMKKYGNNDIEGDVFNLVFRDGLPGLTVGEIQQATKVVKSTYEAEASTKLKNKDHQVVVVDQVEKVEGVKDQEKKALENASTTADQLNNAADIDKINSTGGTQDLTLEHGDGSVSTYDSKTNMYVAKNKTGNINTDYKVIMLAGGAGSGKSTTAKVILEQLDITKDMQEVNVDLFKEDIKEQLGLPGKEGNYEDWQRSLNSRVMAIARGEKEIQQDQLMQSGQGFYIDGTFASYKTNSETCQALEDAGYEVTILKVDTKIENALERNKKRGEEGGRSLPDKIVIKNHEQVSESVDRVESEGRTVIRTTTDNMARGEVDPAVVEQVKNRLAATVRAKIIPTTKVQDQIETVDNTEAAKTAISNAFPDVPKGNLNQAQADNLAKGKKKKFRLMPHSARHAAPLLLAMVGKGDKAAYSLVTDLQRRGTEGEYKFNNYRANVYQSVKGANKFARKEGLDLTKKVIKVRNEQGEIVSEYSLEDAVRIYNWNRAGYDIPGIEATTINNVDAFINNNFAAKKYAEHIFNAVNYGEKGTYFEPYEGWSARNLKQDMWKAVQSKRLEYMKDFDVMFSEVFDKDNLMRLKAGMGKDFDSWWAAVSDYHQRTVTGRTRAEGERIGQNIVNWFHGSTALALFGNVKSAFTQMISTTNYFVADGMNIFKAAANMGTPEYFKAMRYILKSDYLAARGSNYDLALKELTDLETRFKEGKDKAINLSFLLSSIGDRGAITLGGAMMMVERMKAIEKLKTAQAEFDKENSNMSQAEYDKAYEKFIKRTLGDKTYLERYAKLVKKGFEEDEAMNMIMEEVAVYSEKTQQSVYGENLSYQQTKAIGKLTLSFMNTQIKYNNLVLEEAMKIGKGLGDKKSGARIANYAAIQTSMFAFVSSGLQFILMDDEMDDEKKEGIVDKKKEQALWSMAYNLIDGTGISGKGITTVMKIIDEQYQYMTDDQKYQADLAKKMMEGSPALSIKGQKLRGAKFDLKQVYKQFEETGEISEENIIPLLRAGTKIFSFATNFGGPEFAMALLDKYNFIMSERYTFFQALGVALGWSPYSMDEDFYKNRKQDELFGPDSMDVKAKNTNLGGTAIQKQKQSGYKKKKKVTNLGG